jgi:hypothetical protein
MGQIMLMHMDDDLVSMDSLFSIPDRWDYSKLDDTVWDFDPSSLDLHDEVEAEAFNILEQSSASLAYCSGSLQSLAESDSEEEKNDVDHEEMGSLDPKICAQFASTKKNLLPFLDQACSGRGKASPQKKSHKWGPVVLPRVSTRQHGAFNIMEKAKEYQKRKNLEIPAKTKGNPFVVLGTNMLGDMASSVHIDIGNDETDKNHIIANMVVAEKERCNDFILDNPKTTLPLVNVFHDQLLDQEEFPPLPSIVCATDGAVMIV